MPPYGDLSGPISDYQCHLSFEVAMLVIIIMIIIIIMVIIIMMVIIIIMVKGLAQFSVLILSSILSAKS